MADAPKTPKPLQKGVMKQVVSGDQILVRSLTAKAERQLTLAWISTPKVAKKIPSQESPSSDEPYGYEAREFLRKMLIGKELSFRVEYEVPMGQIKRECVSLFNESSENVAELLVANGLATVIKRKQNTDNDDYQRLTELEAAAVEGKVGIHSDSPAPKREISFESSNPNDLIGKTYGAIVEHVISGSTLRVQLETSKNKYLMATVNLSGVKSPAFNEDLGVEAKQFTEIRILQKDGVTVRIESVSQPGKNAPPNAPAAFNGSVICKEKNIAEFLAQTGLAKCVDWTLHQAISPEKLRAAENEAKAKKINLWKNYVKKQSQGTFLGKVVEIINGDALMVEDDNSKDIKKVFLASVRAPPRPQDTTIQRNLYDIPFMFEAREFLRQRLIGKRVKVTIDYIQPKSEQFPEKQCATVLTTDGNVNVAEALLGKGLGTCVRYRPDDEARSSCYDQLREAEMKAQAAKLGLHGNPEKGVIRIVELTGDVQKAKSFLPFLQRSRSSRSEGIVEHVYSASRLKVYVPKENCALNLVLAGIASPKQNEPFAPESIQFVKSLIMQQNVAITVDGMDKVGNFIGQLYFDHGSKNLSSEIVKKGFASIRDERGSEFQTAEDYAKKNRLNIWTDYVEPIVTEDDPTKNEADDDDAGDVDDKPPKADDRKQVIITLVSKDMQYICAQYVKEGPALEKMMDDMREDLEKNPPLPGAYTPKKGDVVCAKYSLDHQWYRARIEKVGPGNQSEVVFIDYGNREVLPATKLAPLPSTSYGVVTFPEGTKKFSLAFVSLPDDVDSIADAREEFEVRAGDRPLLIRSEYKDANGQDAVTLLDPDTKKDIVMELTRDGYFYLNKKERRKERKLAKLVQEYRDAEAYAKKNRNVLWRYGDFTEDDAREFGAK